MPASFQLRLMGDLSLAADGQPVTLPSRRAGALLACLAVDGPTSRAALADRLWPGGGATAARRNLRRELARLRDAGLDGVFSADGEMLALADDVACDVAAFVAACGGHDAAAAVMAWGGPLLDRFALAEAPEFDSWVSARRASLAERWLQALATRADQLEQLGLMNEALDLLARLREADPLQERHHATAMRLHQRLGQPAAALAVYAQCARLLRDELGVEPSAAIRALAARLEAAASLQPVVARGPAAMPVMLEATLVGRGDEVAALRACTAPLLLVTGEAGVGKTRLVQETLPARTTLVARCEPQAGQAALYPLAEALRTALLSPPRATRVAALPQTVRAQAARLLPEVAGGSSAPARALSSVADATQAARERFLEALCDLIDAAAGDNGVLWIDDLHWADEITLDVVARLAHRRSAASSASSSAPAGPVRVVAAARTPEVDAASGTGPRLRRLERAGLLQRLPLDPLGPPQTLSLVRQLSGTTGGELFAARLHRATAGNPFHLFETLRYLFGARELQVLADGTWTTRYDDDTSDYGELPVPPTVFQTVIERAEVLPATARRLLDAAALTRAGFTLTLLCGATALEPWQAVEALDELVRLRLFSEDARPVVDGGPGYRFTHDLAREAFARALRPERRRLIHDGLARALIQARGAPDHIAWHLEEAGRASEAGPWRLAAAREAARLYAWRGMLAHLVLAYGQTTDVDTRARIARERRQAGRHLLDLPAQVDAARDLAQLASETGRDAWRLEALLWEADLAQLRKQPQSAIEPLRRELERGAFEGPDRSLRAKAHGALGNLLLAAGQVAAAEAVLAGADPDDVEIGDDERAALLVARANAARLRGDAASAQRLLRAAIGLLQAPAQLEPRLQAQNLLAHTHHLRGDGARALATLEATLDEAERAHLVVVMRSVLPNLATLCAVQGQAERAEHYLQRGMQALREVEHPSVRAMLASRLAELRLRRGELGGALAAAQQSIASYEANGGGTADYVPWVMIACVHAHAGDCAGAVQVFDRLQHSPALQAGAGTTAVLRVHRLAAQLPGVSAGEARQIADVLAGLREAPDGAYAPAEADHARALALLRAGAVHEAAAVAATLVDGDLGLLTEAASVLALRLRCGTASGAVDPALVTASEAALATAGALPALDLREALWAACRQVGDVAAAARHQATLADAVDRLAASLAAHPTLAGGLRRHWQR